MTYIKLNQRFPEHYTIKAGETLLRPQGEKMHRLLSVHPQAAREAGTGVHQRGFHHLFNHSPLLDIKFKVSHYKQHCMYLISLG